MFSLYLWVQLEEQRIGKEEKLKYTAPIDTAPQWYQHCSTVVSAENCHNKSAVKDLCKLNIHQPLGMIPPMLARRVNTLCKQSSLK